MDQATWVPLPRRRAAKVKLPAVLERANKLVDWYMQNRPEVTRMAVSDADWQALAAALEEGATNLFRDTGGIRYRGMLLYRGP